MLNYLQRLILILPFDAPHADSFTSCMIPVETSTTPYWPAVTHRQFLTPEFLPEYDFSTFRLVIL